MWPSSSTSPDWSRLGVSPSQAPTDRDLRKFSGSSTAVANEVAVTAPPPGPDIRIWHASLRRALVTSCRPSSAARKRTARHAFPSSRQRPRGLGRHSRGGGYLAGHEGRQRAFYLENVGWP